MSHLLLCGFSNLNYFVESKRKDVSPPSLGLHLIIDYFVKCFKSSVRGAQMQLLQEWIYSESDIITSDFCYY